MLNPIHAFLAVFLIVTVLDFYKHVVDSDSTAKSLRRENARLIHRNRSLEAQNLQLKEKNDALLREYVQFKLTHTLQDEHTADEIATLQAEIRKKDKMLEQKWKAARAACEAANG